MSGPEHGQRGSFLELSWNGRDPLELPDGASRTFLLDGDEVVITAVATGQGGTRIPLGEVRGAVTPPETAEWSAEHTDVLRGAVR